MKVYNIDWDIDRNDDVTLPSEVEIPDEIADEGDEAVSDYLSNLTGYCHKGFTLEGEE